ncbi:tubulin delta chain-like [Brachionus plicatilis]|uniref:Tubulin delta chain n=1 Tax=Brachionus plicatilis TaxID=10195 RepID=A0A3M7Q0H4_BRAPC|nr:tubulin delta chain-like [Brachionus plicatilis]
MSSIVISVGQCGNQISNSLIDQLLSNQTNQTSFLYSNFDNRFHFINIDSEIKVIKNLLTEHSQCLRRENVLNTKCGRGSNWASGYSGLSNDGALKIIEQSLESVRKEAERCDFLLYLCMMHSLSGGTGSGCGSRLIEELRNEFGWKKLIFTQSVAPFRDGELPLQHYNNLLCLSHLHEHADFIGLYQNDDILSALGKPSQTTPPVSSKTGLVPFNAAKLAKKPGQVDNEPLITLSDMNDHITNCFLNTFNPVDNISLKSQGFGMEFLEIQRFLCPNFNLKVVETLNVNSFNSTKSVYEKTNPLMKKMSSSIVKFKPNSTNFYTSLNSLFIARGLQDFKEYNSEHVLGQLVNDMELINKMLNPVKWNPFTVDFWTAKNSLQMGKTKSNSLTLCTNRNRCCDYLKEVGAKARIKYSAKAYLHWYDKFNISSCLFENAFENLDNIVDSYDEMTI